MLKTPVFSEQQKTNRSFKLLLNLVSDFSVKYSHLFHETDCISRPPQADYRKFQLVEKIELILFFHI